jgi:hypothetical protein
MTTALRIIRLPLAITGTRRVVACIEVDAAGAVVRSWVEADE